MGGPESRGVRALGLWGAGPLTGVGAGGGAFQSSIRSRWVGQGVVRRLGGSIKTAAVRVVEARHRSELARACAGWSGRGRNQVRGELGHVAMTFIALARSGGLRQRICPSRRP